MFLFGRPLRRYLVTGQDVRQFWTFRGALKHWLAAPQPRYGRKRAFKWNGTAWKKILVLSGVPHG